ncbi:hypothetical protein [Nocardia sp. NPDC004260]
MIALGWAAVITLPLGVLAWAMWWPERIPPERSVEGIRARVERERRAAAADTVRLRPVNGTRPDRRPASRRRHSAA